MDNKELVAALQAPFGMDDLEWRIGRSGKTANGFWGTAMTYISARAVQDRLDECFGIEGWQATYRHVPGGVMCELRAKVGGEWIVKEDGAENTDFEAFKGGISGSLKRAAVHYGIGRYLYRLSEGRIRIVEKNTPNAEYAKTKEGEVFYWLPPTLPEWALPTKTTEEAPPPPNAAMRPNAEMRSFSQTAPVRTAGFLSHSTGFDAHT